MEARKLTWCLTVLMLSVLSWSDARSQQPLPVVGFIRSTGCGFSPNPVIPALAERGWIDGRTVRIESRCTAAGTEFERLARELVALKVNVIVTPGTPPTLAAQAATSSIPIVFYSVGDPVGQGIVDSLQRPGRNLTGISGITLLLSTKRLQLLQQIVPSARRFAMLINPTDPSSGAVFSEMRKAAEALQVRVESFRASSPDEIAPAFRNMQSSRIDALLVQPDGMLLANQDQIVRLADQARMPAMYSFGSFVQAGGLISYGATLDSMAQRAAEYVDKILRGAAPQTLAVERASKIELMVNMKAAQALGITIPQSIVVLADTILQ